MRGRWSCGLPGSAATLLNPTSATPRFVADVAGRYRAQLIVSDGLVQSAADTVDITTVNQPPTANAGADQNVLAGATVNLNGSGSSDPDNNPLTYSWTFFSKPNGSNATLTNATTATPSFVADLVGVYIVRLVVNDTIVDSALDEVQITASPSTIGAGAGRHQRWSGVGRQATLRVTLPAPAPTGGVSVEMLSDDTNLVTVGPPAVIGISARRVNGRRRAERHQCRDDHRSSAGAGLHRRHADRDGDAEHAQRAGDPERAVRIDDIASR